MNVIVTLTTIPSRLNDPNPLGIRQCIESLIVQDYKNFEIHFNVPFKYKLSGEEYAIPEWLTVLVNTYTCLKIFRVEDKGPITKVLPTLERITDPETIIIVVDDDIVYVPEMVSEHVKKQAQFTNCALGYDGLGAVKRPIFHDQRDHYVVSVPLDVEVKILQHYKSVSYKRKYFKPDFFTDFLGKTTSDDILLSAYMTTQGIKKFVLCYDKEDKITNLETWCLKGGVLTFPVVCHTTRDGPDGCSDARAGERFFIPKEFAEKGLV